MAVVGVEVVLVVLILNAMNVVSLVILPESVGCVEAQVEAQEDVGVAVLPDSAGVQVMGEGEKTTNSVI